MDPTTFGWESDELSFGSTNDATPHGHVTMQITFLMRKFRNVERNLQCDVGLVQMVI